MSRWQLATENRADCEACDWESSGKPLAVYADAKRHKRENRDHIVIIWRESWREVTL